MNWEAISAVGEIVSATTVVVTLIYLAIQIRHSTKATQAVSIQTASALDQDFLLAVGADPTTAHTWTKYLTAPQTLTDDERLQGAFLLGAVMRRLENIYLQKQLGSLSEEGWVSRQSLFVGIARSPGYLVYLESLPATLIGKEFLDYMARLVPSNQQSK